MELISSLWWLWLILIIVCTAYALYNQVKRIKGMAKQGLSGNVDGAFNSFSSGLGAMIFAGGLASVSFLLLLLAIIFKLIH